MIKIHAGKGHNIMLLHDPILIKSSQFAFLIDFSLLSYIKFRKMYRNGSCKHL